MRSTRAALSVATMRPTRFLYRVAAAGSTAAVALVAPSTTLGADAVYGGATRSGHPIVLKSDSQSTTLRSLVLSWRAECDDGSWMPGGGALTPVEVEPGFEPSASELLTSVNGKGRFKGTQLASRDLGSVAAAITVEVQGKLKPNRASGSIDVEVQIIDKASGVAATSCNAKQSWSASHSAGTVYGGATSQGAPIVMRLNAARKRVNDVYVTWSAGCTEGGFIVPDRFGNFPVKPTGAFGDPFDFTVPIDGGGSRTFGYALAGKIGKTSAKGTLQVKVTDTDAAGTPGGVCDTGGLKWKVTST